MTNILELMESRKSCRAFAEKPIEKELLDKLLDAACHAPSSGGFQNYAIIKVTDEEKKQKLAEVCGGKFIAKAPVNLVFCMDLHRERRIAESFYGIPSRDYHYEGLTMLVMDAAIAAHNLCIAAESFGLGSVYVGNVVNRIDEVTALLHLPGKVLPVIMVTLGYPKTEGAVSLKYSREILVHENEYAERPIETLKEAFEKKYADWKMPAKEKRVAVIAKEAERRFGAEYAKKCVETIHANDMIDPLSFWHGYFYADRSDILSNEEQWAFLARQGLIFTTA